MTTFNSLYDVKSALAGGVVTIGNFDGVHRGHRALIRKVCALKDDRPGALLTFSPHPRQFFDGQPFFYLTTDQQKSRLCESYGLDAVIIHPLSRDFLALSPQAFVHEILHQQLMVRDVVVGDDFAFGNQRKGGIEDLIRLCAEVMINVHVVSPVFLEQQRCSSSAIREHAIVGQLDEARLMLGRPFSVVGTVVADQGRATALGFPTANLKPHEVFLKCGVYASLTRVWGNNGIQDYLSATNVGVRPSVSTSKVTIETHCLDVVLDLYGAQIEIYFIDRVRDEQRFSSLTELQAQVQRDFQAVRQLSLLHPHRYRVEG